MTTNLIIAVYGMQHNTECRKCYVFLSSFLESDADESLEECREKHGMKTYLVLCVIVGASVKPEGTNNCAEVSIFKFMFTK